MCGLQKKKEVNSPNDNDWMHYRCEGIRPRKIQWGLNSCYSPLCKGWHVGIYVWCSQPHPLPIHNTGFQSEQEVPLELSSTLQL